MLESLKLFNRIFYKSLKTYLLKSDEVLSSR